MQQLIFSIIIPTYNRPQQLKTCLSSLTKLNDADELFEVIVVDDGSSTALNSIIDAFTTQLNIQLISQANVGPAAARNAGAQVARGRYLAFTDDDCCPDKNWLTAFIQSIQKTPDCIFGGQTINNLPDNLYAATSQLIVDMVYQYYNDNPDDAQFFASNNMVIPTTLFHHIKGFNNTYRTSEDRELCYRWLGYGNAMRYCADAIVYHAHTLNLAGFCRQHFLYGRGAYRFYVMRNLQGAGDMRKEINFHTHLHRQLTLPLKKMKLSSSISTIALLLVWQVVNALGFFWQAGLSRVKSLVQYEC